MYTPLTSEERDILARAREIIHGRHHICLPLYSGAAERYVDNLLEWDAGNRPEIDSDIILGDEDLTLDHAPADHLPENLR